MNKVIISFVLSIIVCNCVILAQNTTSKFNLKAYEPQEGLIAALKDDVLTVTWDGDPQNEVRVRFTIEGGTPIIEEIAINEMDREWQVLAQDVKPYYHIVSGLRRVTQQQTEPLEKMGVPLTEEKLNEIKWDAFWDAPLYVTDEPPLSHTSSIPAEEPFANHPGMPRSESEINRSDASFNANECVVRTNGAHIEIVFSGFTAGIFEGRLQYDIYKGTNLIRQMAVAKTDHPSAAFKYDAGLTGLPLSSSTRMVWRDIAKNWQEYLMGGPVSDMPSIVLSNNRLIAAQVAGGSIAAFPPPHSFYWARESEQNLGYSWYRKDSDNSFSFGMRQAELEQDPEFYHNFALYSAPPGTWQRMPVFFYVSAHDGGDAVLGALEFTNDDKFRPLPGYKVMGHHYHVGLVKRLKEHGGYHYRINDIATMKSIGLDIFSIIDGARGPGRHDKGELFLNDLYEYYEAARSQSDKAFLVMPNDENSTGGRPPFMGGHYDIIIPKPFYWTPQRKEGEPLYENHPKYGRVYHIGTPEDMMAVSEIENVLISMPHPNSKRSTGYPEAIKDEPQFLHENYYSLGYRWGMGMDASETRLGESRFLKLWNQTNNWMAEHGQPPKMALAISEARSDKGERGKPPYDDAYGMSPVNYIKIDSIPSLDDMSSITNALKNGEYFMTTGEILIPYYEIQGEGDNLTVIAEVEWTFPLDFVEIVWGDGKETGREIISATDLPPFGKHRFEIPFDASGKKWMRFAAWDVAINGALTQPVSLID